MTPENIQHGPTGPDGTSAQPRYVEVPTARGVSRRIASIGTTGFVLLLLTVIALSTVYNTWTNHSWRAEQNRANCNYIRYSEDSDKPSVFSDLSAQNRALADLYDCQMSGR